jgi:hypothetical protein
MEREAVLAPEVGSAVRLVGHAVIVTWVCERCDAVSAGGGTERDQFVARSDPVAWEQLDHVALGADPPSACLVFPTFAVHDLPPFPLGALPTDLTTRDAARRRGSITSWLGSNLSQIYKFAGVNGIDDPHTD